MTMQQIAIETLPGGGAPIRVGEIAIDEAEIAREMQHHPADSADGARDAGYRRGMALIAELEEHPERFTDLARRHSACPSKESGGELGWLAPGQTVAELDRALQTLPEGLHDRPLASRYGWHLVCIDARRDARPRPFEAVAERVRHTLCEQASRRALRHYLLALEAEIGVTGFRLDDDAEGALMQ